MLILPGLKELQRECETLKSKHYAETTKPTRESQVKKYMEFCDEFAGIIKPFPCDSAQVCLYVAYMARKLQYVSIINYLSGLNDFLKQNSQKPIDYEDYNVKCCVKGTRRTLGDASKQAAPLLPAMLSCMMGHLYDTVGHVCFRAAILTSFRGLLRKAHVTKSTATLRRGDFTFYGWGMIIKVSKSKTIQYAERAVEIPVARLPKQELCAVYWTERHFEEVQAAPNQEAYRMLEPGKGSVPLKYSVYQDTLKHLCGEIGLEPRLFSSHSLRRGGATFLYMAGASIAEIKRRGDWTSDCVYKYLTAPLKVRIKDDMRVATMFLQEAEDGHI